MGKAVGLRSEQDLLGALTAGDLGVVLEQCGDRLLTTVWGSDPFPTFVPRTDLAAWFRSRDALTDEGVRIRPLARTDLPGPTVVALLHHSLARGGHHHAYETVDRWVFHTDRVVGWFSRPVDPAQYALAWGLRHPKTANRTGRTLGWPPVVELTGAKGPAADDDPPPIPGGR